MTLKKALSLLLAVALVVSSAVIAMAESADTPAKETMTADDGTAAPAEVFTLEEMLNLSMTDAYYRQAAYAAYAQAFPDSRVLARINVDSQIVLLEMLLKAHDAALPMADMDVAVPETEAEALQAIAEAESNTVTMIKSYLAQESLTEDARMIFSSVLNSSRQNAAAFLRTVRAAKRAQQWTELFNGDNMKQYVFEGTGPRGGSWTVCIVTNDPDFVPPVEPAAEPTEEPIPDTTGN